MYTKHNETKKSEAVKDNFDWKITATTLDVTDTEKKKIKKPSQDVKNAK